MTDKIPVLGRLETVDLREVWPSEPYSFTPWLAQTDNLQFLADALGLPSLELVATERPVDIFAADIVARAPDTGQTVLIENQIERSDHIHLGQILTYAAGLDAAIIVWVARKFTEGHRAALDWLNRITAEEFAFFGVEVEALRIGDSQPAPRFNIVARPNAWTRQLKAATAQAESNPLTVTHSAFWSGYEAAAGPLGAPLRAGQQPVKGTNYLVRIGKVGQIYLTAFRGLSTGKVGAYVSVYGPNAASVWEALLSRKTEIEAAFGGPLGWEVRKEGQVYWITAGKLDAAADELDWSRQQAWLAETMKRLAAAVTPIVLELLENDAGELP
jgi:hypothetical protein